MGDQSREAMTEYRRTQKGSMSAEAWYKSLPPATQLWLTTILMVGVARHLGGVQWQTLAFDADAVFSRFEVWRMFTSLTLLNINPLLAVCTLWMMIATSDPLEREAEYLGDYTYTLMMGAAGLLSVASVLEFKLLGDAMVFFALGVWCGYHRQDMVPLLWAIPIPTWIFAGFFATLYYCVGGEVPVAEITGLLMGMVLVWLRGSFIGSLFCTPSFFRGLQPQYHEASPVASWGRGGTLKCSLHG